MLILLLLVVNAQTFVKGNVPLFEYNLFDNDETEPPVYVEKMENVEFFVENWKFITRLDMKFYDNTLKHLQDVVNQTSSLCGKLDLTTNANLDSTFKLKQGCDSIKVEFEAIMEEMERIDWTNFVTSTVKNKEMFFTDKDLQTYIQKFDEMNASNIETFKIDNERTTFIKPNTFLFQNNKKELKNEKDYLCTLIANFATILSQKTSDSKLKGARVKNLLQDIMSYTTVLIMDFKDKQKTFIEISSLEIGSEMLLPPKILLQELKQLLEIIGPKQLPFNIYHESIATFYKFALVQSKMINKELIIAFMLPIVESEDFDLYQLTAYPRQMNGEIFQLLLPDVQHVIMNRHTKHYITMNDDDLDQCHRTVNNTHLCQLIEPVISTEDSGSCAIDLLTKVDLTSNCNYRIIPNLSTELWVKLREQNSWLFVFPQAEEVTIDCIGQIDTRYVIGAGTLTIKPQCSVKTKYIEMQATEEDEISEMYKSVELTSEMKFNWKEIMGDVTKLALEKIKNTFLPRVIDDNELDILQKISTGISDVKSLTYKTGASHKQQQEVVTEDMVIAMYVTVAIALFALTCKVIQLLKNCFIRSKHSDTDTYIDMGRIV